MGGRSISIDSLKPALLGDGEVRVSILAELPALVREFGMDYQELLAEVGVPPTLLDDPENIIQFKLVGRILELCAERTGWQDLGLLLGQRGGPSTIGVVGLLMANAPDIGTALRGLIRYSHHQDRGAALTLTVAGNSALLAYVIYEKDTPGTRHIYATAAALACNMMRGLCGPDWRPEKVLLPFRRPADPASYQRHFRAPVEFGAKQCAMVIPGFWLEHPPPDADLRVHAAANALIAALEARGRNDVAGKVRALLTASLTGEHSSEAEVARVLAMHRRTLNRRLRLQGTTFQEILGEVRFAVARQLLRDTDIPIQEIAAGLGYAASSPFCRAFRQWSGTTPLAWRSGGPAR